MPVRSRRASSVLTRGVLAAAALSSPATAQLGVPDEDDNRPRGVLVQKPGATAGVTLLAPLRGTKAHLVDMDGTIIHEWETGLGTGSTYLLDDGSLMLCGREPEPPRFRGGGQGGRLQKYSWDGELLWDYTVADDSKLQHHDLAVTPKGTVLFIAWEHRTPEECLAAGRDPERLPEGGMWPDFVCEVEPDGLHGGKIIWEWHAWDHLIQNHDREQANYGDVDFHPERIDINGDGDRLDMSPVEIKRLQALGYIAPGKAPTRDEGQSDWLHTNGIDYSTELDQIVLSVPRMNEVWIIDHSTTTEEAATSEGGNSGRGGDLLFRWGNPQTWLMGTVEDKRLFFQHDPKFIPPGYPGEGNLTIFNNGGGRHDGDYSTVIELELPWDGEEYFRDEDTPYEPYDPMWSYGGKDANFFSGFISGAHRLPNGNTFICEGDKGRLFEVTPDGEIVWEFMNDIKSVTSEEAPNSGVGEFACFRATRIPFGHPALERAGIVPAGR